MKRKFSIPTSGSFEFDKSKRTTIDVDRQFSESKMSGRKAIRIALSLVVILPMFIIIISCLILCIRRPGNNYPAIAFLSFCLIFLIFWIFSNLRNFRKHHKRTSKDTSASSPIRMIFAVVFIIGMLILCLYLAVTGKTSHSIYLGIAFLVLCLILIWKSFSRYGSQTKGHVHIESESELCSWAQSKGLGFRYGPDSKLIKGYGFNIFKGSEWIQNHLIAEYHACNIVEGTLLNQHICAFDYWADNNNSNVLLSAVIVNINFPLKPLQIWTGKVLDPGKALGVGTCVIEFESTEFNKQFYVTAQDKKWAYDVLHQRMMEYLLKSPRFNLEFAGNYVLAYRLDTLSSKDIEDGVKLITGILDLLPESVVQQQQLNK